MRPLQNKLWVTALAALAASLAGCSFQDVSFSSDPNLGLRPADYTYVNDGFQNPAEPDVFRVAFDSSGNPYPDPRDYPVESRALEDCGYSVRAYFAARGGYDAEAIARDFGRRITAKCGSTKSLVILIAGIDNTYDEARRSFLLARMVTRTSALNRDLAFLEVYWDGYCGNPIALWPWARESSKWTGLGLRVLLCSIDSEIPLRVITHSRGASVICSALWNLPLREDRQSNERFLERASITPTPSHPGIRIGLLAPAMPEADFESYFERTGSPAKTHNRVILGVNEDDPALHKGGLGSGLFGSTSLGCHLELFEPHVGSPLNTGRRVAYCVNFSGSRCHDFKDYLLRRPFLERFLPLLLEEDRAEPPARRGTDVAAPHGREEFRAQEE